MFKVNASSIDEYLTFDPRRTADLGQLDTCIKANLPELKRWFYDGVHKNTGGMHMQLIGYGSLQYKNPNKESVTWPIIGVAHQKNYISVYLSVHKDDGAILDAYRGKLGEVRSGHNNFSFTSFDSLSKPTLEALLKEIGVIIKSKHESALRYHS